MVLQYLKVGGLYLGRVLSVVRTAASMERKEFIWEVTQKK